MSGAQLPTTSAIGLVRVALENATIAAGYDFQFGRWESESENHVPTVAMIPESWEPVLLRERTGEHLLDKKTNYEFQLWAANFDDLELFESWFLSTLKSIAKNWTIVDDSGTLEFAHCQWGVQTTWKIGIQTHLPKWQVDNQLTQVNTLTGRYSDKTAGDGQIGHKP